MVGTTHIRISRHALSALRDKARKQGKSINATLCWLLGISPPARAGRPKKGSKTKP